MIRAVDESSRSAGQLLDHATVAYRAEDLARDQIDLADLATTVVDALQATAGLKDIEINTQTTETPIMGDKVLLESALRNVLDNAVKYSPDETTVTVFVESGDEGAVVNICDEGPGFDEGSKQQLTRRFKRGANVTGIVGSGLGLTIASEVLSAHGGTLRLENNAEGVGACVSLILPQA